LLTDISDQARTAFLELFPAKSRPRLATGAASVLQCLVGRRKSTKQLGTVCSRWLHYFLFCDAVGLEDNALLENVPQPQRNVQMALYAVHLASGGTLFCRAIKSATIGNYLRDVANFLARFLDADARKVDATQSRIAPVIQSVLDEVLHWEKVPDKREPFTPAMWEHLHSSFAAGRNTFSLGPSICNWFGCGLFGGFRLTEWAQEAGASCFTTPLLDDLGIPKAFCLQDLEFRLPNNKQVSLQEAFQTNEALIHRAIVTFTHKKNGNKVKNGRLFATTTTHGCVLYHSCCKYSNNLFLSLVGR
jgi:hypothetical protein